MSITSYTELKTAIAEWLVRPNDTTSFTTRLPDFIEATEEDINNRIRNRRMQIRADNVTVPGQNYYELPDDFLEAQQLTIESTLRRFSLRFMTVQQMDTRYTQFHYVGEPRVYTVFGNQFRIAPIPDNAYPLELFYWGKLKPLSNTNPTNWLLDVYPRIYLYGALTHASSYIIDKGALQTWTALYEAALKTLVDESKQELWNAGPLQPLTDTRLY